MTLARFSLRLIASILMPLVVGTTEAANITAALATNALMPAKETGTSLRQKNRHLMILCCGASGTSFKQITPAVSFQNFSSTNRLCICKLLGNGLTGSESCLTEATGWFGLWSSSAAFVNVADTLKKRCFAKPYTCIPTAPSFGRTPSREMEVIGVCETMQQMRVESTTPQSNQLAETAHLESGFVALSELTDGETGARWQVPEEFYGHLP
ncbi:hypothetical protein JJB98_28615 [Bradyrhizobium diazoefficiens]|nr:hypothetical protein [Bradyrhizobium diazoefficiens]QQO23600.1 hypothetical protein JJB98_28615 [Bradyrhizobium diazoefficiens]